MADPATIALAVKAAVAAASDKRTWKAVAVLIAAILTPFILIIVMIVSMLSATAKASPEGETFLPPGEAMGDGSYQALITEAEKYLGYPYVWGGSSPSTSFDCSGFVCWVYTYSGVYSLPRTTASGIYNQCVVVPRSEARPGDLIFFTKTYATTSPVSHSSSRNRCVYVSERQNQYGWHLLSVHRYNCKRFKVIQKNRAASRR